jgi:hypothetical protein
MPQTLEVRAEQRHNDHTWNIRHPAPMLTSRNLIQKPANPKTIVTEKNDGV